MTESPKKTDKINVDNTIENESLKPLGFWKSVLYFGIAAVIMAAMYYGLFLRWRGRFGIVNGYFYSFIAALLTILFLSIALFYQESDEKNPATWQRLIVRFNLKKLKRHDWKWVFISLGLIIPISIGMGILNGWLLSVLKIPIPWAGIYEAEANAELLFPTAFQVIMMFVVILLTVLAEEMLFRGFIYPRQESLYGNWTWVVHGLMWWAFYAFRWFNLPSILVSSLLIPFLWHKTKNTTATMIAHFIGSMANIGVGYILLLVF